MKPGDFEPICSESINTVDAYLVERQNESLSSLAKKLNRGHLRETTADDLKVLNPALNVDRMQILPQNTLVFIPEVLRGWPVESHFCVPSGTESEETRNEAYLEPKMRDLETRLRDDVSSHPVLSVKFPNLKVWVSPQGADHRITFRRVGSMAVDLKRETNGVFEVHFGGYFPSHETREGFTPYRFEDRDVMTLEAYLRDKAKKGGLEIEITERGFLRKGDMDERVRIQFIKKGTGK